MKKYALLLSLMICVIFSHAQLFDTIQVAPDIKDARILPFPARCCFVAPLPSKGPGHIRDYQNPRRKNPLLLLAEKHSSWHYIIIPYEGLLYMDLIPLDSSNDYDFAFFKTERESDPAALIASGKLLPELSCISRNDPSNGGITGLRDGSEELFVNIGPGRQFIKPLEVHKGDKWLIYIDNNAANGSGFKLKFQIKKMLSIQGIVKDDEGNSVKADISVLNDRTGEEVHKSKTDDSGKFQINIPIGVTDIYTVLYSGEDHFFVSQTIKPQDLMKGGEMKVRPVLPVLKAGKVIPVNNINFFGDLAVVIPASKPVMRHLLKLMQSQSGMHIRICGHVNGCDRGPAYTQKLSDDRAAAIYQFLLTNHISSDRMEMKGYGCTRMIYPKPKNEFENEQNRRVEIEILRLN